MDRSDELRKEREAREERERREAREQPADDVKREGDVLGISGAPVPKAPGDPTTEYDEESIRQRRDRAMRDDAVRRPSDDQHGATGVDMGSGGHGTDVSGD